MRKEAQHMSELQQLVGKFCIVDEGEGYRTGEVKAAINNTILVQFDRMKEDDDYWSWPMELHELDELIGSRDGIRSWGFFDTREQLAAFIAFMDRPDPDDHSVVRLHRTKR
jgi:hypothetical protein